MGYQRATQPTIHGALLYFRPDVEAVRHTAPPRKRVGWVACSQMRMMGVRITRTMAAEKDALPQRSMPASSDVPTFDEDAGTAFYHKVSVLTTTKTSWGQNP